MSNLFLYIVTVLIWGSTWFAIEFQLGTVAPEISVVYRYVLASALLFAWSHYRKLDLAFGFRQHGWFMLLGLLLFCLNYIFAYRAQLYITSALTAIAFSSILWMNIINARIFFGVRSAWRVLLGALLGIAGILTLFAPQVGEFSFSDSMLSGLVLAVAGALVASFGNIASQAAQKRGLPIVQSNAWGMLYGAIFSFLIAAGAGKQFNFDGSASYMSSLVYLAVFGSVIAFWAYLTLLGRIGAHKAGYAMVMFPVVALILSILFEGLEVRTTLIVGTVLVLAGNLFVLDAPLRRKQKDAADSDELAIKCAKP